MTIFGFTLLWRTKVYPNQLSIWDGLGGLYGILAAAAIDAGLIRLLWF